MTMIKPISHYYDKLQGTWQGTTRTGSILLLFISISSLLWAGPAYDQGIEAFQYNCLDEAALFFEQAIREESPSAAAYRYLGLAYEQLGQHEEALSTYRSALDGSIGTARERALISLELGLALSRSQDYDGAAAAFDQALQLDNTLSAVYLNRANVNVARSRYERAISDYRLYLTLRSDSTQRPQIEQMIALLADTIEAERKAAEEAERQRLQAEEAARVAEEADRARREEEQRQAEARRQNMLTSVLQSLSTAGTETHSYETEDEDISDYSEDLDILD